MAKNRNNVAIYCRLSREDDVLTESSSIKNQKEILSEYALENGWNIFNTYIDDGYSGGNFNRPGFQQMIEDIENHQIDIVITKDLSRLGRNYIQTGYYTEEYFPSKNVRYIAINDNYDSNNGEDDLTPFKNIINQWYLKDISKKVRASLDNNMRKGLVKNPRPLFGYYVKDDCRFINPETAPIVKRIFKECIDGESTHQIARNLQKDKVPTPGYYAFLKHGHQKDKYVDCPEYKKYDWSDRTVGFILGNTEYTGDLILKKEKTISYKTHKRVRTTPEEQYFFPNKFEGIITKEEFKLATSVRNTRKYLKPKESDEHFLIGFMYCGECGQKLVYREYRRPPKYIPTPSYYCRDYGKNKCPDRKAYRICLFEDAVKQEIRNFVKICKQEETAIREYAKTFEFKDLVFDEKMTTMGIDKLIERNKTLNILIQKLFEKNASGDIPDSVYQKMMSGYREELSNNNKIIEEFEKKNHKSTEKVNYEHLCDIFFKAIDNFNDIFDRTHLVKIIDKIYIKRKGVKDITLRIVYRHIPELLQSYFEENENE